MCWCAVKKLLTHSLTMALCPGSHRVFLFWIILTLQLCRRQSWTVNMIQRRKNLCKRVTNKRSHTSFLPPSHMTISAKKCHTWNRIIGYVDVACTLRSEESCKVLSSHLTDVSVTFVTLRTRTGSNFKTASALGGLFSRLLVTPKVR